MLDVVLKCCNFICKDRKPFNCDKCNEASIAYGVWPKCIIKKIKKKRPEYYGVSNRDGNVERIKKLGG